MSKPVSEWTEDDVLLLPPGENDAFERKGTQLLDLNLPQTTENNVRDELAKQLSAFANTGGGQIIYGITNAGAVDSGGIARVARGRQTTKEWLEDIIPGLTDFEIVGVNVFEIRPKANGSLLAPDRSLYVVDVPDSDRAPHQSRRDLKYYVRLGSKSLPAPHRLIEDIRNRIKHPKLIVHDLRIVAINFQVRPEQIAGLTMRTEAIISVSFRIRNVGKVRSSSACLQIEGNVPFSSRLADGPECFLRNAPAGTVLLELRNSLYPGMGIVLGCPLYTSAELEVLAVGETVKLAGVEADEVVLSVTAFSDSAPPERQEFKLAEIDPEKTLQNAIRGAVRLVRRG